MNIVGVDLGYRQTKLRTLKYRYKFPSLIGNPSVFEIDEFYTQKDIVDALELEYDEEMYYVGSRAQDTSNARLCIDTDKTESVNEKVIYRALLGILSAQEGINNNVSVVTGLPVEDFKQAGLKEMLISNMKGTHKFVFQNKPHIVEVNSVVVIPQSAGAYYDYVLDDNGDIKEVIAHLANGVIIVVDVGYKTTDVVTMVNGNYDSKRSFTIYKGMRDIHKELGRRIRYAHSRKFDLAELDSICKDGIISDCGIDIDVRPLIAKATKPIAEAILTELNATIGDTRSANKVIGAGGSMSLLDPYFQKYYKETYEKAEYIEECNANGYAKYGKFVNANNNKN